MFQEEEPGKPQNWCYTITVITIISLVNVFIFVFIRILLDSEDEFDVPIIQGKLRQDLTHFLGIFSLSFCFGCWCCFCCTGNCLKVFAFLISPTKWKLGLNRIRAGVDKSNKKSSKDEEEQIDMDVMSSADGQPPGNGHPKKWSMASSVDYQPKELKLDRRKAPQTPSSSSSSSGDVKIVTGNGSKEWRRPSVLIMQEEARAKAQGRARRWTIAPIGLAKLPIAEKAKAMEEREGHASDVPEQQSTSANDNEDLTKIKQDREIVMSKSNKPTNKRRFSLAQYLK